jgi:hypothetical protein
MMSRKFLVYMHTTASATLTVEMSDARLQAIADGLGVQVDKLTYDDLRDHVEEHAFEDPGTPDICAQCSGWGNSTQSLELGDDWEVDEDEGRYKAVIEITDK